MKQTLLSLALAFPALCFAQSNFQKGYIITNARDTTQGYINYKERSLNPVSVDFRSALNSKSEIFNLENCAGYTIYGQVAYKRYAVNVSSSYDNIARLASFRDTSFTRDTVFLEVLQAGKNVTLLSYRDRIKTRFYIQDKDMAEPAELIRNLYYKEGTSGVMVHDDKFIRQILLTMRKFNGAASADETKLAGLKYAKADLIDIVSDINGIKPVKSESQGLRLFAGLALNASKFSYTNKFSYAGENDLANAAAKAKVSYLPMLTAGVDLMVNPAIGRLIFRGELSISMGKGDISTTTNFPSKAALSHSFDQLTLTFTPQMRYNFYNAGNFKVFGSIGAGLGLSKYNNNRYSITNSLKAETKIVEDLVTLKGLDVSLEGMLGVVLNKKVEFLVGYSLPTPVTAYRPYSIYMQRLRVGVNYLFANH